MNQPQPDDFERYYNAHARELLAFLSSRVQPRTDLEDVVQEVWLRVLKNLASFQVGTNFRPWLFQIARNYLIDRSRRPRPALLPGDYDAADTRSQEPSLPMVQREDEGRLQHCLQELNPNERALVAGRLQGEDYAELSQRLDLTITQAQQIFHRAKTRLRDCVQRNER